MKSYPEALNCDLWKTYIYGLWIHEMYNVPSGHFLYISDFIELVFWCCFFMISMMWYWNLPSSVWLLSPVVQNITSYRTSPVLWDFWLLHHYGKHKLMSSQTIHNFQDLKKMDFEFEKNFALTNHFHHIINTCHRLKIYFFKTFAEQYLVLWTIFCI